MNNITKIEELITLAKLGASLIIDIDDYYSTEIERLVESLHPKAYLTIKGSHYVVFSRLSEIVKKSQSGQVTLDFLDN